MQIMGASRNFGRAQGGKPGTCLRARLTRPKCFCPQDDGDEGGEGEGEEVDAECRNGRPAAAPSDDE